MTAADVVFTFNLLKKDPSDINAVWSVLSSVTQRARTKSSSPSSPRR